MRTKSLSSNWQKQVQMDRPSFRCMNFRKEKIDARKAI